MAPGPTVGGVPVRGSPRYHPGMRHLLSLVFGVLLGFATGLTVIAAGALATLSLGLKAYLLRWPENGGVFEVAPREIGKLALAVGAVALALLILDLLVFVRLGRRPRR